MKIGKRKILSLFLGLFLVAAFLCSCTDKGEIQGRLKKFESAANRTDVEEMLELLYPKTAGAIESAADFVAFFSDNTSEELLSALAQALFGFGGEGLFSSLEIKTKDILVDGNEATAKVVLRYRNDGETTETEGTFYFKYYAEEWYLSGFLPG